MANDYDWPEIKATLETIAAGEEKWTESRKAAHSALRECMDAIADAHPDYAIPHLGDRPDWRRMPGKAKELLFLLNAPDEDDEDASTGDEEPVSGPEPAAPHGEVAEVVLTRLREGGGVTMAMLREVTDVSERDVRDAIKELRAAFPATTGDHPVNYSSKWWTAGELERMGKQLQPTARGSLKVVPAPRAGDPGDSERTSYKSKPKSELLAEVRELLEGHPDAEKVVLEVVSRIDESFAAKANYKEVCAEARKEKERAEGNLKEAAEQGRDPKDNDAALVKLDSIENAWQAKEEAIAKGVEERKEARERKKRAEVALEQLMGNLRQLELAFPESN